MLDLILHHYPMSPFSEKVRMVLGFKQLAWMDAHAGCVHVHFPRVGYALKLEQSE